MYSYRLDHCNDALIGLCRPTARKWTVSHLSLNLPWLKYDTGKRVESLYHKSLNGLQPKYMS